MTPITPLHASIRVDIDDVTEQVIDTINGCEFTQLDTPDALADELDITPGPVLHIPEVTIRSIEDATAVQRIMCEYITERAAWTYNNR